MTDRRIRRAKAELAAGVIRAQRAKLSAPSRSTGSRNAYKAKAEAADSALAILSEPAPRK